MKKLLKTKLFLLSTLIAIILFGFFLRIYNVNWDQNSHLHPDERFLTMVAGAMQMPSSVANYLNPQTSLLNPTNIGFDFYVYGIFPVTLTKGISLLFHTDTYDLITLNGRTLSAFFDTLVLIGIAVVGLLWEKKYSFDPWMKVFAVFVYAIAVLPIQLSHFFAVDTFLSACIFGAFVFIILYENYQKVIFVVISGIFLGLALASKITGVFVIPLLCYFILPDVKPIYHIKKYKPYVLQIIISTFILLLTTYICLRLTDPYIFANGNLFDPHINQQFIHSIQTLQSESDKNAQFPPIVQWITKKPILFPLQNFVIFGFGVIASLLSILGIIYIIKQRKKNFRLLIILAWIVVYFIYEGIQTASTMRYFLPLYPFLSLFAGIGLYWIYKKSNLFVITIVGILLLIWPMAFFSIYTKPHTRITASVWIFQHIPADKTLLGEYWDDALPLNVKNHLASQYVIKLLPVFDPDTTEKWQNMNQLLDSGDYLILSSNRGWGSIPTVPERYPKMSVFYKNIFADKTQYKKIAEFTSYPSLKYLGIPITFPDDWAEEAFTVYDHPKVMIFQKK